ncbi:16S rRNA (adenine(1518)-N(6)/adenine(1519)-N(6))-dimethyltransferase RsmA [Mycoplasma sp. Pen4]|uniref:16S rRNA (adenine(1518)-N(6)/adenine(1519)-N(6))- dimethyltransferase RsmA n=1 Tax=Mycoplasma sp. Pen4 TaxID=640330 RepID=UPI0016546B40|nr:16S rRNA (adenine(1518)-N(6)/adenine(1519)-N(6))-dimethyltransferase RsmA [Mycoplasma sp. Pen4]QNM93640.1 16S rRNA (adenine(1518)-N(6)/adenine(1519)-N(6))-dimethyltransferase RsmA [Mycoplasma sp. Pen4]
MRNKKDNKKEVYAKKHFGQNFLKDNNIIKKIIEVFDFSNQNVVEIGPGRGALTKELIKQAKHLTCYEIDQDMVNVINSEIISDKLTLLHQDFLKADLNPIENAYLIANIPYYITTDILFKVFENKERFKGVLLMVQKEVAERICAKPNTSEYSKLSVSAQYLAECKIEFIVPASCFSPTPKVDSAIISLVFKDDVSSDDWNKLKDFFKDIFANRRKKLSYSLKNNYSKDKIQQVFASLGYDDNLRIQQLDVETIVKLFELLNN